MNKLLLNTVNQNFINSYLESDIVSLLLGTYDSEIENIKELIEQIEAKKRCKLKLPIWFNTSGIYFPNKLNIEQTSSELTAEYKSTIVKGRSIIDLTGGFGIDTFFFSKYFDNVIHCEIDSNLSEIAKHNFNVLGANNISSITENGIDYLKSSKTKFDLIYIDPSRRHDSKGKVFYLKDCLPDITKYLDLLLEHSNTILIKASPMLDISIGLSELKWVKEIHIVAIRNEVKELLFLIEKGFEENIKIKTNNISPKKNQTLDFFINQEDVTMANYRLPKNYLYEPNSAIMKAGAFNIISKIFSVYKLHKHSHLYTSENFIEFPGRCFKIKEVFPYSKREVLKKFSNSKANITIRNFPESVAQLRAKFKIKDGGELFLFFTTNADNKKIVIVTTQ